MTTWHILFDQEPEVIAHLCTWHKRAGGGIQCSDMDETGDCAHVQFRRCTCEYAAECSVCLSEREGVA